MNHGFALIDHAGQPISPAHPLLDGLDPADTLAIAQAATTATRFRFAQLPGYGATILAAAPPDVAAHWPAIDPSLIAAARRAQALILCCKDRAATQAGFADFAQAFGWSPSVTRTVLALFQHGDVALAARHSGISVHTAREHLLSARLSIGAANLPTLVMLLGIGGSGITAQGDESPQSIAEIFGLTQRQLRIADSIANGHSRETVAAEFHLSHALVSKELAHVFDVTGATNAIALARLIGEARALAMVTSGAQSIDPFPAPHSRTIIIRHGARQIAANDYGPPKGRPVLVLHSSMTDRSVNRQLVEALQNAGFRPLSLDRPGFGDTDALPDTPAEPAQFFTAAAQDMVHFCAHMKFESIDIVTRGAAQVALALHDLAPQLIGRAVILNPDPDSATSHRREGRMGAVKHAFAQRPWAVAAIARMLAALVTYSRFLESTQKSVANSPPDRLVMSDPANLRDYYRGVESYHQGRIQGFIHEQVALATCGVPAPRPHTPHIHVLIGEHDFLHDPQQVRHYWAKALPHARIRMVKNAGRFLAYSHPDHVIKALRSPTQAAPALKQP